MLDLEPNLKKKKGAAFFERDEDLDMEWIKEHQAFLMEEQTQKIKKKFEKDNEKRVADGEKEMKVSELNERLEVVKEMKKKFDKENKSGKVEAEGRGPTVEKLEAQITKLDQRVDTMSVQAQDKEDNKEVALGTSKIVSSFFPLMQSDHQLIRSRTTLTLASRSSSARSSMCPLRGSSPRPCAKSSSGPSSLWKRTGSSSFPPVSRPLLSSHFSSYLDSGVVSFVFSLYFFCMRYGGSQSHLSFRLMRRIGPASDVIR